MVYLRMFYISFTFKRFRILSLCLFSFNTCFTLLYSCMACNKESTVILTTFLYRENVLPWGSFSILILILWVCLQFEYMPRYRYIWSLSCLMFFEFSRSVVIWYSSWNIFSNYFFSNISSSLFPLFTLSFLSIISQLLKLFWMFLFFFNCYFFLFAFQIECFYWPVLKLSYSSAISMLLISPQKSILSFFCSVFDFYISLVFLTFCLSYFLWVSIRTHY